MKIAQKYDKEQDKSRSWTTTRRKENDTLVFDYRYPKCIVRARGIDVFSGRRYTTTGLT